MLRRVGLLAVSVIIGASASGLTDALKTYLTSLPFPLPVKLAIASAVALLILFFDWSLLDKDRPLKVSWWYWRLFYLRDLIVELERQLNLEGHRSVALPEILDVVENAERVPIAGRLLPLLRSASKPGTRLLILGEPGAGKTILTLQLTHKLACEARARFWRPMPVLLPMSGYREGTLDTFARQQIELATEGDGGKVLSDGFDRLMKKRRFLFILDALDEIPEAQLKRLPADLATWARPGRGNPAFLATARAREIHPDQLQLKPLHVFHLVELSDDAVRAILRTFETPERAQEIHAELQKRGLLDQGGLGRNPFWLEAMVLSRVYDQARYLILKAAVSNLLLREWNKPEAKRGWTKAEDRDLQFQHTASALGWLAFQMLNSSSAALSYDEARLFIDEALSKRLGLVKLAATDVISLGRDALLLEYTGTDVRFRHQILQSYFGATALIEEPGLLDALLGKAGPLPYRWWNSILLVNELDGHHRGVHEKLLTTVFSDGSETGRVILAAALTTSIDYLLIPDKFESIQNALTHRFLAGEEPACIAALQAIAAASPPALISILRIALAIDRMVGSAVAEITAALEAKTIALLKRVIENEIRAGTAARTLAALFREYRIASLTGAAVRLIGSAVSDALLSAFATTPNQELVEALGETRTQAAVPALLRLLSGELRPKAARGKTHEELIGNFDMFRLASAEAAAVKALGKIGAVESIPALLTLAQRNDIFLAPAAVASLVLIGTAAIPALLSVAQSDTLASITAPADIAKIGPAAVSQLLSALREGNEKVRQTAIEALGEIGDGSAAVTVASQLADLPVPAARALARFGADGANAIIGTVLTTTQLPRSTEQWLLEAFKGIGVAGLSPVMDALPQASPDKREFLIRALGKTGAAASAAPHVLPLLEAASETTRRAAIRAVGDWKDPQYSDVIFASAKESSSFMVKADSFIALAQMGVQPAIDWMLERLAHGLPGTSEEVSTAIQEYLAVAAFQIGLKEAIPVLENLTAENPPGGSTVFKTILDGLLVRGPALINPEDTAATVSLIHSATAPTATPPAPVAPEPPTSSHSHNSVPP